MSWVECNLEEMIDVKHGFAFKGKYFNDTGKYIVLTPGNCHEKGGLKLKGDKEKRYSAEFPEDYLLSEGDLLVVMTDLVNTAPVLGGSFLIPEDDLFLHNQRLGLVDIKDEKRIDKKFLYHLFNTHNYRGQIRGSASGATVRHTSPSRIKACAVLIPDDLNEQKKIAKILANYDDLIENNRRRIQLLEESARFLYKEWFVHLRFPGHEHVKITDGVPEGWELMRLVDFADLTMGQSPKSEFYNEVGEGLPFHQGVTNYGYRFVTHKTYSTKITRLAESRDILCSVRAPVGRLNITLDKMILGRGLASIRAKSGHQSFLFYSLRTFFFKENIMGSGAIYASVTKKDMEGIEILIPSSVMLQEFEDQASEIDLQIINLSKQNYQLAQARDILLPRLMNGDLAV